MGLRTFLINHNPNNRYLIRQRYRRLKDHRVSLVASNCLGGIMYHVLGVPFASPFVNTLIGSHEFVRIVADFERYMGEELHFITSDRPHPVAMLGDVEMQFPHVRSQEEAESQWLRRKQRIHQDRLFFMLNDNGLTEDDLDILDACNHPNILVFTAQFHPDHRCVFQLPSFANQLEVGNTMTRNLFTGRVLIEQYFDFVGWLNQDKGAALEPYRIFHHKSFILYRK